jgi:hypothetical protein
MALVAAIGGALIGLMGSDEPARAQTVGSSCTTADGQPGTFVESQDPFTGTITIVCSAGGGSGGGGVGSRRRMVPGPYIDLPYDIDPFSYGVFAGLGYWGTGGIGTTPNVSPLGGPVSLSLFGSDGVSGVYTGMGAFSTRNDGYRVIDTAGAVPAGSLAPGFHALDGGAGVNLAADGTRLFDLNANQQLLLGVTLNYHHRNTDFDTSALTPGLASAGSVRRDAFILGGSVDYGIGSIYFSGRAAVDWSHADITNAVLQSQGNTNGVAYQLSAVAGKIFSLINSTGVNPATLVKAPPKAVGGYAVFLDVSGRLGYRNARDDGFTDSAGFVYGTEQLSYWTAGARANLVAAIPVGRATWLPYVGVTFDQQLDFRHTFDIPNQVATVADVISFGQGRTWWGVQGGLNVLDRGGLKAGLGGYYAASSDTSILGGKVFVKVPLFADAVGPARDSGIRTLSK